MRSIRGLQWNLVAEEGDLGRFCQELPQLVFERKSVETVAARGEDDGVVLPVSRLTEGNGETELRSATGAFGDKLDAGSSMNVPGDLATVSHTLPPLCVS